MALTDKRQLYKCDDEFVVLGAIDTWAAYHTTHRDRLVKRYPTGKSCTSCLFYKYQPPIFQMFQLSDVSLVRSANEI